MSDETPAKGGRSRRDRLPHNRQRERVLQLVREHGDAIDAVELASQLGLHVTTVRFHLDALCDEGAVERTRISRDGVGRPRTGYRAIEERLNYRILAELLAMELGETVQARAGRARHIGQQWADRIAAGRGEPVAGEGVPDTEDRLRRGAVLTAGVFDRMGFDPELVDGPEPTAEQVIRLRACPARDLARAHPEVGCGIHLGLLQGLLDDTVSGGLDPFVEPELCIATLHVTHS